MPEWFASTIEKLLDFSNILNASIAASWMVLAVIILRYLLKKAPRWTHVALWGLVAVRMLLPFSIESAFSLIPSKETVPREILVYEGTRLQESAFLDVVSNPVFSGSVTVELGETVDRVQISLVKMNLIWIMGIAVLLLYTAVSYWRLRRRVSEATILRGNIYQSENVASPFVLGLIRPRIYLPYGMNEQDLGHVVAHEQAHIRRRDHWWKPLGFFLLTIHWFNPLMWMAYVLLCRDIELACDEKVIKELGDEQRADYTQALVVCSVSRRSIAACPLAFGEVGVKERVKSVMNYKKPAFWIIAVSVITCAVVAICFLTNPVKPQDSLELVERNTPAGANEAVYIASFGNQIHGGLIYAEQWSNGECVRSSPAMLTQNVEKIGIRTDVRKEDGSSVGVDVQIDTYGRGGSLITYFAFPDANAFLGWSFTVRELNEPVTVTAQEDIILAAMAFDAGNGVRAFDCQTLESEPKRLEDAEYMIVIRACFHSEKLDNQHTEPGLWSGELIPGTTYVPYQCLYMNPLSSFAAIGGDSGCKYVVGENYFATIYRSNRVSVNATNPDGDIAQHRIEVPKWKWQKFPYSDEEWAALYWPEGLWSIEKISERYNEMLYQPLTSDKFLLKMDNSLWLVDISNDPKVGTYIWSIYSLVPESAMGAAQWEYAPQLSSRIPVFPFNFELEYTEIIAYCTGGLLGAYGVESDSSMTIKNGETLYWSPVDRDGNVVTTAIIRFSVRQEDTPTYNGTIYIEGNSASDGRRIYTATIVGTGLHLSPNSKISGGVLSAIASSNVIRVVEHDLTTGDLEVPVKDLVNYVFYTNSKQISVTVKGNDFEGQVNLLDVSQNNAHILQAKVNTHNDDCLFTGLTSARLYRVDCEGLENCTVVISGDK